MEEGEANKLESSLTVEEEGKTIELEPSLIVEEEGKANMLELSLIVEEREGAHSAINVGSSLDIRREISRIQSHSGDGGWMGAKLDEFLVFPNLE
ncbi:hypothetical protein Sjap_008381 [Stephania japonica]|uniref:Uncharacterized protein n=1 Tax=Stephania japonica TaxID=461633 RepID=A0AAP0JPI6_9MAGN